MIPIKNSTPIVIQQLHVVLLGGWHTPEENEPTFNTNPAKPRISSQQVADSCLQVSPQHPPPPPPRSSKSLMCRRR